MKCLNYLCGCDPHLPGLVMGAESHPPDEFSALMGGNKRFFKTEQDAVLR